MPVSAHNNLHECDEMMSSVQLASAWLGKELYLARGSTGTSAVSLALCYATWGGV